MKKMQTSEQVIDNLMKPTVSKTDNYMVNDVITVDTKNLRIGLGLLYKALEKNLKDDMNSDVVKNALLFLKGSIALGIHFSEWEKMRFNSRNSEGFGNSEHDNVLFLFRDCHNPERYRTGYKEDRMIELSMKGLNLENKLHSLVQVGRSLETDKIQEYLDSLYKSVLSKTPENQRITVKNARNLFALSLYENGFSRGPICYLMGVGDIVFVNE